MSSTTTEPCRLLPWDSTFFGFPIAAVAQERIDEQALEAIAAWSAQHQVRCLYYECPAADQTSIGCAERGGFELVDVRLLFAGRTRAAAEGGAGAAGSADRATIRPAHEEDVAALKAIAAYSHTDSRFFADGRFSADRAAALFSQWIANAVGGRADVVLVAEREGKACGYAALRLLPAQGRQGKRGRLDLFAVAREHRRRGIGRQLIESSRSWFAEQGASAVLAATQGRNSDAQHIYQRCGFVLTGVWLYYHKWFPAGGGEQDAAGGGAREGTSA